MLEANVVNDLKEEAVRKYLVQLIYALDELDGDDFFGTEGWRHYLGFDD